MPGTPLLGRLERVLVAGAGLLGAGGVILAALAAHVGGGESLAVAGSFGVIHAAVVLAIATGGRRVWLLPAAGVLLLSGGVLFCTGVAVHALAGVSLGPVAPLGGTVLILGWLLAAVAGIVGQTTTSPS